MIDQARAALIQTDPYRKAQQTLAIARISAQERAEELGADQSAPHYTHIKQTITNNVSDSKCGANEVDFDANGIVEAPGLPEAPKLVDPTTMPKRKLGSIVGRQAMIHAIAHIEFSAINLALDAIQRFGDMPDEYYQDWLSVAQDESRHFLMLAERLDELGSYYGAFEAHDGLWVMAERTKHNVLDRMAIVPRMMEARGLDMNPLIMKKLSGIGDDQSVKILQQILDEEINHVSIGNKWFHFCCGQHGLAPNTTFIKKFWRYFKQSPKGALNIEARIKAGFTFDELDYLQWLSDNATV